MSSARGSTSHWGQRPRSGPRLPRRLSTVGPGRRRSGGSRSWRLAAPTGLPDNSMTSPTITQWLGVLSAEPEGKQRLGLVSEAADGTIVVAQGQSVAAWRRHLVNTRPRLQEVERRLQPRRRAAVPQTARPISSPDPNGSSAQASRHSRSMLRSAGCLVQILRTRITRRSATRERRGGRRLQSSALRYIPESQRSRVPHCSDFLVYGSSRREATATCGVAPLLREFPSHAKATTGESQPDDPRDDVGPS